MLSIDNVQVILRHQTLCPLLKSSNVLLAPPIMKLAIHVVPSAHIIETVRELVPENRPNSPVVPCRRVVHVVQRFLQKASGNKHAVDLPGIRAIHLGRIHRPPTFAIDRLAQTLEGSRDDPFLGLVCVVQELLGMQFEIVILPCAVTDLDEHGVELFNGELTRGWLHPCLPLKLVPEYCSDVLEKVLGATQRSLGHVLVDEELGHLIGQVALGALVALAPPRLLVLHTCQEMPNLQSLLQKRSGQIRSQTIRQLESQIRLVGPEIGGAQELREALNEAPVFAENVVGTLPEPLHPEQLKDALEADVGRDLGQLVHRQVRHARLPKLLIGKSRLCKGALDGPGVCCRGLGVCRRQPCQLHDLFDHQVKAVSYHGIAVRQRRVHRRVWKCEAAIEKAQHVAIRVLGVSHHLPVEVDGDVDLLKHCDHLNERVVIMDRVNGLQVGLQRFHSQRLDGACIHACSVEHTGLATVLLHLALELTRDARLDAIPRARPLHLVRLDPRVLNESPACELIEVLARILGRVHSCEHVFGNRCVFPRVLPLPRGLLLLGTTEGHTSLHPRRHRDRDDDEKAEAA
mmetsp:Transcript_2952/g.7315  ORF Transcript_2952/g.7315 Transcript_2952/m.7315 type:complete len:573 (+) Transcript_2952:624-2342(+)